MTLERIARLANVSVSTVSRALNDSYDISPETRALVLKIAEEQGYFTKKKQVKLENRCRKTVNAAIICPEIYSIHYANLATMLSKEIRRRGSECTVFYHDFDADVLNGIIEKCVNDDKYNAIICMQSINTPLRDISIPVITTGGCGEYSKYLADMNGAMDIQVEFLLASGKKNIAFAGEAHTARKLNYIESRLKETGNKLFDKFISAQRFEEAGKDAAEHFLSLASLPDAVICAYDEIAYGLIHTLNENGIRVPEDVGVIGMNDIPSAAYVFNGLTTVGFTYGDVFMKIVDDIHSAVLSSTFSPKEYRVKAELKKRKTV